MKHILKIFLFFLIFNHSVFCQNSNLINDPLLVVVIMVKDEEKVINATLEPYIKAGVNHYLIFDTGSTDKTIETVEKFFKDNNVQNYFIIQEPFVNFSVSRNRALELTEEKFPNAVFMLMPDAEWYIHNVQDLIYFCQTMVKDTSNVYLVRIIGHRIDFCTPRLIRCRTNTRFFGRVHEIIDSSRGVKLPETVYFKYEPNAIGVEKSVKRWQRDRDFLLQDYKDNPNDPRTTFYLAQTLECLGDFENAYKFYEIRSKQAGWSEENYETFYRLGRVTLELSKTNKNFTWPMAYDYYMQAFKMRPHRAEPLVKVAEHYWPDNIPLCYVFAKRALDLPYPKNEYLFIDKEIYDFIRYEILSKAAWYVGEYEVGEMATIKAIKARSDLPYLNKNLEFYWTKKLGN